MVLVHKSTGISLLDKIKENFCYKGNKFKANKEWFSLAIVRIMCVTLIKEEWN